MPFCLKWFIIPGSLGHQLSKILVMGKLQIAFRFFFSSMPKLGPCMTYSSTWNPTGPTWEPYRPHMGTLQVLAFFLSVGLSPSIIRQKPV